MQDLVLMWMEEFGLNLEWLCWSLWFWLDWTGNRWKKVCSWKTTHDRVMAILLSKPTALCVGGDWQVWMTCLTFRLRLLGDKFELNKLRSFTSPPVAMNLSLWEKWQHFHPDLSASAGIQLIYLLQSMRLRASVNMPLGWFIHSSSMPEPKACNCPRNDEWSMKMPNDVSNLTFYY